MYVLKIFQTLIALVQVQNASPSIAKTALFISAMNKALELFGGLRINEPVSLSAELKQLDLLIATLESELGYEINIGELANVLSIADQYAQLSLDLDSDQFAAAFEATEIHDGVPTTYVVGAIRKDALTKLHCSI